MNYRENFLKSINKIAEKEIDKVNINQHYLEVLESQDKENIRLNNIINELEKWLVERIDEYKEMELYDNADMYEYTLYTLQELKGSDKE